jgi:hypothetical protein
MPLSPRINMQRNRVAQALMGYGRPQMPPMPQGMPPPQMMPQGAPQGGMPPQMMLPDSAKPSGPGTFAGADVQASPYWQQAQAMMGPNKSFGVQGPIPTMPPPAQPVSSATQGLLAGGGAPPPPPLPGR